jgi:hypothetical protein
MTLTKNNVSHREQRQIKYCVQYLEIKNTKHFSFVWGKKRRKEQKNCIAIIPCYNAILHFSHLGIANIP